MDNFQELIRNATILMDGTREQRHEGEELLRKIVEDARGTRWAKMAGDLLGNGEKPDRPVHRDPELVKYSQSWSEIQGMNDPRLVPLLRDLKSKPRVAARLRPEVVKDIRKWVEESVPRVAESMNPKQLCAAERFVEAVSEIEAYNVDEIKHLRKALFGVLFRDVSRKIYKALEEWSIDEAWGLFGELHNSPSSFQGEVAALQDSIYKCAGLRKAVEELLEQSPKHEPEKWVEMHVLISSMEKLHEFIGDPQVSEPWKQRLRKEAERNALAAEAFLIKQAAAAMSLDDLKSFSAEYERIITPDIRGRLGLKQEWFQTCLNYLVAVESAKVAQAKSPDELKEIGASFAEKREKIPQFAAELFSLMGDEISQMAKNWRSMHSGYDFLDPASIQGLLPLPERLTAETAKYRELLDQIQEISLEMSEGSGLPPEQVYAQAAERAQDILTQVPEHAGARELKSKADRGALSVHLDKALSVWEIETFLGLSKDADDGGSYRGLARNKEVLHNLAALATESEFLGWRAAARWWREWRIASRSLPQAVRESMPDSFRQAIRAQEADRMDQWYAVLEELRNLPLPPEECEDAAESLMAEMEVLNLQGYHKELVRKAKAGFVLRYIEKSEFDKAEEELGKLDPDHRDTMRLRTRLIVEQASLIGVSSVAEVLRNEWNNIVVAMDNANAVLLGAVQRAWEEGDAGAIEKLKEVLNRVLTPGQPVSEDLNNLQQWQLWLRVEDAIKSQVSLLSVSQLISYLEGADPEDKTLHKRLKTLVDEWNAKGDTKMLAWAYQAFNRIDPSVMPLSRDPAKDLIDRSNQIAEKILGSLRMEKHFQPDVLRDLQNKVKREKNEWDQLSDFLDSLHHPVSRSSPPMKLLEAIGLLEELLEVFTDLERLGETDLRQEESRDKLESIRLLVKRKLKGYAIQQKLLDQIKRLSPLGELFSLEQRIKEAAEECASDSPRHYFSPEPFPKLAKAIRNLIEKFIVAEAESGSMWRAVSDEYCDLVYEEVGIFLPRLNPPDLRLLADRIDLLQAEEAEFMKALERLRADQPPVPAGARFDPESHREYLNLLPKKQPGARKLYRMFDRVATSEVMNSILQQSRPYLPDWVRKYLDEGVP